MARPVKIADSANPLRHPPFLDELAARTFHRSRCDRCGHVDVFDGPLLWTDVGADLVAWVVPEAQRRFWVGLETHAIEGLTPAVRQEGPAFVRAWGAQARLRLVFGLEELREKVVARRHRLDDALVEVLKLPFLDPETATCPVLESVGPDGLLLAAAVEPSGRDPGGAEQRTVAVIPWAAYEGAVDRRAEHEALHPGLFRGAWVHCTRSGFGPGLPSPTGPLGAPAG